MASVIGIYNQALGHIGLTETISGPEEKSKARVTCDRFYETARDSVLADFPWRFATRIEYLADIGNPPTNWGYQYRYPSDCKRAIRIIVPGSRVPLPAQQIPFQVRWEQDGTAIVTDQEEAQLAYVTNLVAPEIYPPMFVEALAYKLASLICNPMTNKPDMESGLLQRYELAKQQAWAQSLGESCDDQAPDSEFISGMHG